jgi:hypothetical protein
MLTDQRMSHLPPKVDPQTRSGTTTERIRQDQSQSQTSGGYCSPQRSWKAYGFSLMLRKNRAAFLRMPLRAMAQKESEQTARLPQNPPGVPLLAAQRGVGLCTRGRCSRLLLRRSALWPSRMVPGPG